MLYTVMFGTGAGGSGRSPISSLTRSTTRPGAGGRGEETWGQRSTLASQYDPAMPSLHERLIALSILVDRAIQGTREEVSTLHPTTLDAGLDVGLERLTSEFSRRTGCQRSIALPDCGFPDGGDCHLPHSPGRP